ncbi:erythromycin esterase family protein [Amycolatopsis sp. NPDC059027]|uniref:erythromycin esterase family protein n=1 Tax=unclassified Amycolatopsis TaxID=2618356 RepID=UPI00366D682E
MSLREIGRPLDDPASLGRALDELLATRAEPPALFALGEPAHGVEAFPLLRNEILGRLVERGYRSIALETDVFAASVVDDYVGGAAMDLDTVLATGFSHGFGDVPGNRELVEWLRAHNADRAPSDRVRFHGFDAPLEISSAPSPRRALFSVNDYLPSALRPASARELDTLLGEDADWTNEAAAFDPAASIGDSDRVRALRLVADDLASALHRAAPDLRFADPTGFAHAVAHARAAQGLLRYHAAMANTAPDRVATLFGLRSEMMAENLHALVAREEGHGPSLVFAHNGLLQRHTPTDGDAVSWGNPGALVELTLGERYLFVATDASPESEPETLQRMLAEATTRRTLFPAAELRAALPASIGTAEPMVRGHLPLTQADLSGADAVVFIADTDGKQHQYW